jgi:release factor glutamine methyltransferase
MRLLHRGAHSTARRHLRLLRAAGIDSGDAATSLRVLAEEARALPPLEAHAALRAAVTRRAAREPLQYIVGSWPFSTLPLPLSVRAPVLIPRPETEELVEVASAGGAAAGIFLDVGTGSGCVSLALLHKCAALRAGVALDASSAAVALARANAAAHGRSHQLTVVHSPFQSWRPPRGELVDLLVANLPYLVHLPMQPEVRQHEDHAALLGGGPGGLGLILRLLALSHELVRPGGDIFLETHESHPRLLHALLRGHAPGGALPPLTMPRATGGGPPVVDDGDAFGLDRCRYEAVLAAAAPSLPRTLRWAGAFTCVRGLPRIVHLQVRGA